MLTAETLSWPFSLSFIVYLFTWISDLVGGNEEKSGIPRGLSKSLPIRSSTKDCWLGTLPPEKHHLPHFSQCLTPCAASPCLGAQLWLQQSDWWDPSAGGVRGSVGSHCGVPRGARHRVLCSQMACPLTEDTSACVLSITRVQKSSCWGMSMQDPEEKSPSQVTLSSGGKLRMAQGQSRGAEGGWGNWVSLQSSYLSIQTQLPLVDRQAPVGCDPLHLQRDVAVALHCGIPPQPAVPQPG